MLESRDPVLTLVVATGNRGKLAELRALLEGIAVEVVAVAEVVVPPVIEEDAETFAGNALKKARVVAAACQCLTLADDSGLEVDALEGRPGVRSARYSGEGATDASNNAKLLEELEGVPPERRTARFRCALALVDPWSAPSSARPPLAVDLEAEHLFEGTLEGRIALAPRGEGGFGYDPLFLVGDFEQTLAEVSEARKNAMSHRARALEGLRPVLDRIVAARLAEGEMPPSGSV